MPYKITWKPRGVIWTFYNSITSHEAMQANLDIYGDPRFDDLLYQIVDISAVDKFDVIDEDLDTAAALDHAATLSNSRLVVAIVATKKEAIEVAKLYEAGMRDSSWKVRVFCSIEDARKWIALSGGIVDEESV